MGKRRKQKAKMVLEMERMDSGIFVGGQGFISASKTTSPPISGCLMPEFLSWWLDLNEGAPITPLASFSLLLPLPPFPPPRPGEHARFCSGAPTICCLPPLHKLCLPSGLLAVCSSVRTPASPLNRDLFEGRTYH